MTVHTERLRLDPIDRTRADDLWRLHRDPGVAAWYGGVWSRPEAVARAAAFGTSWAADGVGKWLAYARDGGELVGRGGASITMVDGHECVELGWAVRQELWGRGYATEIGAAGLRLVADVLDADEVVAYTEVHNRRSRAVMERLGMAYVREIRASGLVEGRNGLHDDAPFALYAIRLGSTGP